MTQLVSRSVAMAGLLLAAGRTTLPQNAARDDGDLRDLPLHEVATAAPGHALAFIMSGDGGWAAADRALADALAHRGIPVVGLDSRSYLRRRRSVDRASHDLVRVLDHYAREWSRDSVVLIGYSRGADLLPFLINRLPADRRRSIAGVALIGLGDHASFEFHWADLLRDVRRPTDLPTRLEVDGLSDLRIVCSYGERERGSLCPGLNSALARRLVHGGDHMLPPQDAATIVDALLATPS